MKNMKKLSILLASTMVFNIFAFPSLAEASTLDNNMVYSAQPDTDAYKTQLDTRAPETKAQTVLDISKGSISIFRASVVGFTPSGEQATVNPAGYEIIGSTTTNTIVLGYTTPITLNGVTMNYSRIKSAIDVVTQNAEITVRGTNVIKRTAEQYGDEALIGTSSNSLTIKGDGILNVEDYSLRGAAIGGNNSGNNREIIIEGDVTINAYKNSGTDTNLAAVIGASALSANIAVRIRGNAVVAAKQDGESNAAVIGIGANNTRGQTVQVDIGGSARVVATGGTKYTRATVIGANNGIDASVLINIQDEALVKIVPRGTDFVGIINSPGMGVVAPGVITQALKDKTKVYISQFANVEAPAREDYYKSSDQVTPVYKTLLRSLDANSYVFVTCDGNSSRARTDSSGALYLYLPTGSQSVIVDGKTFEGTVTTSGSSELYIANELTAANIQKEIVDTKSMDLTGHAISSAQSPGAITYTITDAGTTGATLAGNTLRWTAGGTAILRASQAGAGAYQAASTTFNLEVNAPVIDNKRGVLDISKAPITITNRSVSGQTPEGIAAKVDPDGYEIVGSTTTNKVVVNDAVPININGLTTNYPNGFTDVAINMVNGGEITVLGTNNLTRASGIIGVSNTFIGHTSGKLIIKGDGTLNMTDGTNSATTIGGNQTEAANISIEGSVKIKAISTVDSSGVRIGSGYAAHGKTNTIVITENAKVEAYNNGDGTQAPVIGDAEHSQGMNSNITISGNANVIATGATGEVYASVIGTWASGNGHETINIEDAAVVKVVSRSTATGNGGNPGGMGLGLINITSEMLDKADVRIAPTANVEAPTRETYYKALDGTTPVYRATASNLVPNSEITVKYGSSTATTRANPEGKLYLYLPSGTQNVYLGGIKYEADVTSNGTAEFELAKDGIKTVLDIGKAPITITTSSVTAQTPAGIAAMVDHDGYEIVGSTTTNMIAITNSPVLPVVLNGITMDGVSPAIDILAGGVTLMGTNTITRGSQYTESRALIEQDPGTVNFTGTGTLNITDAATVAATIGEETGTNSVSVNIGSGVNLNIDKNGSGAAIGTPGDGSTGRADINIEDGARVKISNKSTAASTNAAGMGLPAGAPITSAMLAKTTVKVSPFANVEAPARENYYKDTAGTTAVYKVAVAGLAPNADVSVLYNGTTKTITTFADGGLYLYLPVGEQVATIDGEKFECVVEDSVSNKMFIKTILTAANISTHVSNGVEGISLRGHETTNSPAAIKYTITNAGTTGATLNGTTLTWSAPGTITMNVAQAESGKSSSASTDFTVNLTTNPGDIEVSVSVDVSSAGFGRVAVINADGKEIVPFVQPGAAVTLKPIANPGYEIAKWVKTTQITREKIEILPATNGLRIRAKAGESYTAFFQLKDIVDGPRLDRMEVSSMVIQPNGTTVEEFKPLVRQDGTESVDFDPDKLSYGLYLRSIDTDAINIYTRHVDTQKIEIKIGTSPKVVVKPGDINKVSLTLKKLAYQEIPVVMFRDGEETTYVIKVFKPQTVANDPHLYTELEINPVKDVLELGVYAMNVDVNSFEMTMKIDDLLAADKQAFTAFVNNKGVAFNNLGTNLAGSLENYFNLDNRFEIADMRSNGKFINFTVNVKTTDVFETNPIKIGAKPEKILSINVKRNPNYTGKLINEIDTLKMDQVELADDIYGNNLSSKFYGGLNDTFQSNRVADEKTLSYLVFNGKEDFIKMYISFNSNVVDRVSFEIVDVSDPNDERKVVTGPVVNHEINEAILKSTYKVRIFAGGYLFAESEDIVYSGVPSQDGIIMTPVKLLEGNLNNDTVIDSLDRTILISVLNKVVAIKGSGYITVGNDKIYADYNNDNKINSLDFGRLVQNIGKQYSAIHEA